MLALLRFDASKDQGLGHLVRCMAVADAALAAGWIVEVCGDIEPRAGLEMVAARGLTMHAVPEDSKQLAELASARGAALVHVDSYREHRDLRISLNASGVLLSSIEDGVHGRRPADLVIDPSPGNEIAYRPFDGSCRLLRGAKAVPVRQSILNLDRRDAGCSESDRARPGPFRVMIIMGGTDALDLSAFMIRCWLGVGISAECHIVKQVAPSEAANARSDSKIIVHQPDLAVPLLFPQMDLVVTACGTTIWELAFLGVPMALVQAVANQEENYNFAVKHGMGAGLGSVPGGTLEESATTETLRRLATSTANRTAISHRAREIIDGTGAGTIVAEWAQLLNRQRGPSARSATLDDASLLFDWRNDSTVRSVSRHKAELGWGSHVDWLIKTLDNPHRELLVVELGHTAIGTVRFDSQYPEGKFWEVSITVAPSSRGQGLGRSVLAAGERYIYETHPEIQLFAEMLVSNSASYRLFRAAGYDGSVHEVNGEQWHSLTKNGVPLTENYLRSR